MKRERNGIMLCQPLNQDRFKKWSNTFFVQPKLDGFRAVWEPNNGLLSSTKKQIVSVPHIERQLLNMKLDMTLDGELYIHGIPFQQFSSIVSPTKNIHPQHEMVEFRFFDTINFEETQRTRIDKIRMLPTSKNILCVPTFEATSADIESYLSLFMNQGYEGIICRNPNAKYELKRSTNIMKFKPQKMDHYLIVGLEEEVSIDGYLKDSLGAFICEKDGERFNVGTGPALTKFLRNYYWSHKDAVIGKFLEVKYQYLTERKVPRGPAVAVRVVDAD